MIDLKKLREDVMYGSMALEPALAIELLDMLEEAQEDATRLLYATKDYDGFVHVERDKYSYAIECMEDAGRDEPSPEDELNGARKLIDAAMRS